MVDQFGHPLSGIYVGASVYESSPKPIDFEPINQKIQADEDGAFYSDPVGQVRTL